MEGTLNSFFNSWFAFFWWEFIKRIKENSQSLKRVPEELLLFLHYVRKHSLCYYEKLIIRAFHVALTENEKSFIFCKENITTLTLFYFHLFWNVWDKNKWKSINMIFVEAETKKWI